ncbi:hypothetical protein GHJ82_15305 [Sinorhizobium saheli]|nr:hypothetical protein [Sinorhizobium saheli]
MAAPKTQSRHNGCRILHEGQQLLKDCILDCKRNAIPTQEHEHRRQHIDR